MNMLAGVWNRLYCLKNLLNPSDWKQGKYMQNPKLNILMRFPAPIWAMCPAVFSSSFIMDCSKAKAATREKNSLTFSPRKQDRNYVVLQPHINTLSSITSTFVNRSHSILGQNRPLQQSVLHSDHCRDDFSSSYSGTLYPVLYLYF